MVYVCRVQGWCGMFSGHLLRVTSTSSVVVRLSTGGVVCAHLREPMLRDKVGRWRGVHVMTYVFLSLTMISAVCPRTRRLGV